jgi:hypothetical protein
MSEDADGRRFWHLDAAEAETLFEEIFVRKTYTRGGGLTVGAGDIVVDIGVCCFSN